MPIFCNSLCQARRQREQEAAHLLEPCAEFTDPALRAIVEFLHLALKPADDALGHHSALRLPMAGL